MSYQTDFINAIKDLAIQAQQQYGILASLTLAQATLESNWGRSGLSQPPNNNLFGMKKGSWTGPVVNFPTKEYQNGQWITVNAAFRKYDNWTASINDHTQLIANASRYSNLIGVTDYKTACHYIQQDGYASDPVYANLLIERIESYNLSQYDGGSYTGSVNPVTDRNDYNRQMQIFLNAIGVRDDAGQMLIVDGRDGAKTQQAKAKALAIIKSIIQ